MYFATVDWLISIPSFSGLPWMRGAPQSGFAADRVRISARTSAATVGRPVPRRLLQRQNSRKPCRCHAMTVSGLAMMIAARHSVHARDSQTQKNRFTGVSRSR